VCGIYAHGVRRVAHSPPPGPTSLCRVAVEGRAGVPAIGAGMGGPRGAVAGHSICLNTGAGTANGRAVVVKETVELGMGGEL
jgi:hypothetical protein